MLNKQTEQRIQIVIAILSLFGMLAYTFVHTGGLLARYIQPAFVGYLAAFGVELLVAGISFRLSTLKRESERKRSLLYILGFALLVSALANIAEGYHTMYEKPLTLANIGQIDLIQAFIGIAATGLISVMVFAVSEVIGSDVETIVKRAERELKREQQAERVEQPEPVRGERLAEQGEQTYQEMIYTILDQGEQLGPSEMARRTGASKATASKWIHQWHGERPAERVNGNGR